MATDSKTRHVPALVFDCAMFIEVNGTLVRLRWCERRETRTDTHHSKAAKSGRDSAITHYQQEFFLKRNKGVFVLWAKGDLML